MEDDSNANSSLYILYIDGHPHSIVNYNDYASSVSNTASFNAKSSLVIEYVVRGFQCLLGAAVFFMMYLIFNQIQKEHTPFTRKNVRYLRLAAIFVILLGLLPSAAKFLISLAVFNSTHAQFTVGTFLTINIGVVLGMISEIFVYGCAVQEDLDQIA